MKMAEAIGSLNAAKKYAPTAWAAFLEYVATGYPSSLKPETEHWDDVQPVWEVFLAGFLAGGSN
jgi:hypothetical protein